MRARVSWHAIFAYDHPRRRWPDVGLLGGASRIGPRYTSAALVGVGVGISVSIGKSGPSSRSIMRRHATHGRPHPTLPSARWRHTARCPYLRRAHAAKRYPGTPCRRASFRISRTAFFFRVVLSTRRDSRCVTELRYDHGVLCVDRIVHVHVVWVLPTLRKTKPIPLRL